MVKLLVLTSIAATFVLAACQEPASPAARSSAALAPAFAVGGGQSGLSLDPGGLGEQSFAKWQAHEGEPDAKGSADQALYFQKKVDTPVFAAAFAVIRGLEGRPVSDLTKLSWPGPPGGTSESPMPAATTRCFWAAAPPPTVCSTRAGRAIRSWPVISRQPSQRPASMRAQRSAAWRSCSTRVPTSWGTQGSCFWTTSP